MDAENIAKLFEETAITVRQIGINRTLSALWKARLRGEISSRQLDFMQIVCDEFNVTAQQLTETRGPRSDERLYATSLYVWMMIRVYDVQVLKMAQIMGRSRTQMYRYMEIIDQLDPKHKAHGWVLEKKQRIEELLKRLNYGTD